MYTTLVLHNIWSMRDWIICVHIGGMTFSLIEQYVLKIVYGIRNYFYGSLKGGQIHDKY